MDKITIAVSSFIVGFVVASVFAKRKPILSPLTGSLSELQKVKDYQLVTSLIAQHQDFPQPGVIFRDIFPVLRDYQASEALIRMLKQHLETLGQIDVIVGLDSRGFLFGPILALLLKCAFVPVRKAGKLPGQVFTVRFEKEYGHDSFQIQADSFSKYKKPRVVLFDDLLATGGSLFAASRLVEMLQGEIIECVICIELKDLDGRKVVNYPVWSLLQF